MSTPEIEKARNIRLVIYRSCDKTPTIINLNPLLDSIEFSVGLDFSYLYIHKYGRPGQTFELEAGDKVETERF